MLSAEANEVPQAAQGPHPRQGQGCDHAQLRRLRPQGDGGRPADLGAPDRGRAPRTITRHMRRAGRVWIRIFPDVPVSSKPAEVRMGKGKGAPEFWMCRVKPGRIMFEIDGVTPEVAQRALQLASRQAADRDAVRRPPWRGVRLAMKAADLRDQIDDELRESLLDLRKEAFNLRFQAASGQLENTARVQQVRREHRAGEDIVERAAHGRRGAGECLARVLQGVVVSRMQGRQDGDRAGRPQGPCIRSTRSSSALAEVRCA